MAQLSCPWCEADLMTTIVETDLGECTECLTSWRFEDDEPQMDLPLAA